MATTGRVNVMDALKVVSQQLGSLGNRRCLHCCFVHHSYRLVISGKCTARFFIPAILCLLLSSLPITHAKPASQQQQQFDTADLVRNERSKAWHNPCIDPHHVVSHVGSFSRVIQKPILSAEFSSPMVSLASLTSRLDETLKTINSVQGKVLTFYSGNTLHFATANFASSREMLSPEGSETNALTVRLYRLLARVASFIHHMRNNVQRNGYRFNRKKLLDMMRILENGGVIDGEVSTGGIYQIMCDIYRLTSTSGGDTKQLRIEDIEFNNPDTAGQLHDKFYVILKSMEDVLTNLQKEIQTSS